MCLNPRSCSGPAYAQWQLAVFGLLPDLVEADKRSRKAEYREQSTKASRKVAESFSEINLNPKKIDSINM